MGSEACTLFRLVTDARHTYVSVGVKKQGSCTNFKHGYELAVRYFANNALTSTSYDGELQFVPTFRLRWSGTSKKFRKICLFAPLFEQYVFVNFSTNTTLIGTKLNRRCQRAPTMLVQWSDKSPRAFLGFRLSTDTISAKTVIFDTFFTNWLRGSTLQSLQQAK